MYRGTNGFWYQDHTGESLTMYRGTNGFWHQDHAGESVPCSMMNAMERARTNLFGYKIIMTLDELKAIEAKVEKAKEIRKKIVRIQTEMAQIREYPYFAIGYCQTSNYHVMNGGHSRISEDRFPEIPRETKEMLVQTIRKAILDVYNDKLALLFKELEEIK